MLAGNTVVFKPPSTAPISGVKLIEAYRDAGVPDGVFNLVMGPGDTVGEELQREPRHRRDRLHRLLRGRVRALPDVLAALPAAVHRRDGRQEPGRSSRARRTSTRRPRGSCAAAFGFGGQKCSANSRVYVEQPVHDELVRLLVEKTEAITVGDPLVRENWLGPVIDQRAVDRHQQAVAEARRDGAGVHRRRAPDRRRRWRAASTSSRRSSATCRPTTACSATSCSRRSRPSTRSTRSTRRCALANDYVYGLTAGVYSEDAGEVQRFLDTIEAGVLYVNRRAGATTGAWPGVQAFGGWKGSGSTGKSGLSMYYVAQFLREQSHTVVD